MMSQASSEFDELDDSGELESNIFGSSELSGSDDFGSASGFGSSPGLGSEAGFESDAGFGSEVGFEEASSDDLMGAEAGMHDAGFDGAAAPAAAAVAPTPFQYKKQGFSIYTLMLVLSFIALTATAAIMFTYASTL